MNIIIYLIYSILWHICPESNQKLNYEKNSLVMGFGISIKLYITVFSFYIRFGEITWKIVQSISYMNEKWKWTKWDLLSIYCIIVMLQSINALYSLVFISINVTNIIFYIIYFIDNIVSYERFFCRDDNSSIIVSCPIVIWW